MLNEYFLGATYLTFYKLDAFCNHKDLILCTTWESTMSSLCNARINLAISTLPIFTCKMNIISTELLWKLKNEAVPKQVKMLRILACENLHLVIMHISEAENSAFVAQLCLQLQFKQPFREFGLKG